MPEKKVLIVEDNELNMKLFRDLLHAHDICTIETRDGLKVLDLATGTGAIPLSILDNCGDRISEIVGIDLSAEMLEVFSERLQGRDDANKVTIQRGDATALDLEDGQFDVVTMGCGIRNVSDHHQGGDEIFRMLKPGGRVIFLEPSMPTNPVLKTAYLGYFRHVVPTVASLISNRGAYKYFCDSVEDFIHGAEFLDFLGQHGFENARHVDLTFGAIRLYIAERPAA